MRLDTPPPSPDDPTWGHNAVGGRGGLLHFVRQGAGFPLLLLHGWPGFWFDWRDVIRPLAELAEVIAPDLRGFGDSDAPDVPPEEGYTPAVHARDMLALLDALGLEAPIVVAHDLGTTIAQTLALSAPERVRALVLCNPPYPGIGERRFAPSAQREFWYQHFHAQPWAEKLIGHDRETTRLYLAHFYDHWAGRKSRLRKSDFEAILDTYARPGAVRASIAYYRARAGQREAQAKVDPRASQIATPTSILWGCLDPVLPVAWSDRLSESFLDHELALLEDVGHFVPWEAPEEVISAVTRVLSRCAGTTHRRR